MMRKLRTGSDDSQIDFHYLSYLGFHIQSSFGLPLLKDVIFVPFDYYLKILTQQNSNGGHRTGRPEPNREKNDVALMNLCQLSYSKRKTWWKNHVTRMIPAPLVTTPIWQEWDPCNKSTPYHNLKKSCENFLTLRDGLLCNAGMMMYVHPNGVTQKSAQATMMCC